MRFQDALVLFLCAACCCIVGTGASSLTFPKASRRAGLREQQRELDSTSNAIASATGVVSTWLVTSYFADKHCTELTRATYESYGACLLTTDKASDGTDIYYTEQINPSPDGKFGGVITSFYTTSECSVARSKMSPTIDTVELFPDCSEQFGIYLQTELINQAEAPSLPLTGGYMFSTYTQANCEGNSVIFFALAKADNACINTSNKTSVEFTCQTDSGASLIEQAGGIGQTMLQTRFPCTDCNCDKTKTTKTVVLTECGTKMLTNSQNEIFYSAVCDAQFPTPTPPPLPSPGISAWIVTTDYDNDDQCTSESAKDSLLESYGLCLPVEETAEDGTTTVSTTLFKLQVLDTWQVTATEVPMMTFYFDDNTCETPAPGRQPEASSEPLGVCIKNPQSGTYMISELVPFPEEPVTQYSGGFVYTSYSSEQCYSDEKIYTMTTVLNSCLSSGPKESYLIDCSADGTGVVTKTYASSDCTGSSKLITKPLQNCEQDSSGGSWVTMECLAEFSSPTPAPGVDELPIEIQGWLTTREFADDTCSEGPAYESSVSLGLCLANEEMPEAQDGEDPTSLEPIIVYSTRQVTDSSTDEHIVITTFFFDAPGCTGTFYREPEEQRFTIDSCEVNKYDDVDSESMSEGEGGGRKSSARRALVSHTTRRQSRRLASTKTRASPTSRPTHTPTKRPVFNVPTSAPVKLTASIVSFRPGVEVPQPPYAGGYYYMTYDNDQCTGDSATFVYVAPEKECIRYHNGTAYVSSSYACADDGSGGVSIDDYESDDCTGPFQRSSSDASTCAPEDDGAFSSLQCYSSFPSPTSAPALSSDITAWIAIDYFGTDKTCKGQPTDSVANSYGLCLSAGTQDEDGNDLYRLDAIEPQEDEGATELPLTTYYYSDAECTIDAGDPVDTSVPLWNCEKDETGAYAISYYVDGPVSPEAPFPGGYLNVVFDSEDCSPERKVTYTAAYEGTCAESYDDVKKKSTSYQVTCEADGTGVNIRTFSKPFCKGSVSDDFLEATPCALFDENHPDLGSYSVECGEFSPPTPAPAPVMREIASWLAVESYAGSGCNPSNKISWEAQSYGLCVSYQNATDGSTINFVRELVYSKDTPNVVSVITWLYEDEECSFLLEVSEADKKELQEETKINTCEDFDGYSSKNTFQPGPTPPASNYEGGYMVSQYNYETCAASTATSISILPADSTCIPGEDSEAGVKSYSVACDAEKTATITRFATKDCSGKAVDSFVQTPEECVDDAEGQTVSFSSYICTATFPPTPTGPPVPAPSKLAVQGWVQEDKYVTDSCDVVEKSEAFSIGLCTETFDPHSDSLKFELKTATVMGTALSIKTYYFEDAECTMFRNEADELLLEEIGECNDGGDGNYYRQSFIAGSSAPQDPFKGGVVQMDYASDTCSPDAVTHIVYDPADNLCVNATSPSADDDYSFFVTGSETFSCTDTGVLIRHYNQSDCQGDFQTELVRNTQCGSKVGDNGADMHYAIQCYVESVPDSPTRAPTAVPKQTIQSIDFVATQTITGCSIKDYQSDPAVYDKALRTAIAASCGTSSIIPADIVYLTVSAGVTSRRLGQASEAEQTRQEPARVRNRRLLSASSRAAILSAQRTGHHSIHTINTPRRHARGLLDGPLSATFLKDSLTNSRRLSASASKLHGRTLSSRRPSSIRVKSLHGHISAFDALSSEGGLRRRTQAGSGSSLIPCSSQCPGNNPGAAPPCGLFDVCGVGCFCARTVPTPAPVRRSPAPSTPGRTAVPTPAPWSRPAITRTPTLARRTGRSASPSRRSQQSQSQRQSQSPTQAKQTSRRAQASTAPSRRSGDAFIPCTSQCPGNNPGAAQPCGLFDACGVGCFCGRMPASPGPAPLLSAAPSPVQQIWLSFPTPNPSTRRVPRGGRRSGVPTPAPWSRPAITRTPTLARRTGRSASPSRRSQQSQSQRQSQSPTQAKQTSRRAQASTAPKLRSLQQGSSSSSSSSSSLVINYRITTRAVGLTNDDITRNLKANVANGFFDLNMHAAAKDDGAFALIKASSRDIIFSAPGGSYSSADMSTGTVVAIVMGVLVAVCLIGGVAYYYFTKHFGGRDMMTGHTRLFQDSLSSRGVELSTSGASRSRISASQIDYDEGESGFHDESRHAPVTSALHRSGDDGRNNFSALDRQVSRLGLTPQNEL